MLRSPLNDIYPMSKKFDMVYTGLAMFPYGGIQAILAPVVAIIGNTKFGYTALTVVGILIMVVANYLLAFVHSNIASIVVLLAILGGACCFINVSMGSIVVYSTTSTEYGSVSGATMLFLTLGDTIGSVIANQLKDIETVIVPGFEALGKTPTDKSYKLAFSILGIFLIITFIVTIFFTDKFNICRKHPKDLTPKTDGESMEGTPAKESVEMDEKKKENQKN